MSTLKLISKISYDFTRGDAVHLSEYMIFLNQLTSEKFIMLQISNHTLATIQQANVEITQLNQNKEPIRQSVFLFEKMGLLPRTSVVPQEKILISSECVSIECKVIPIQNHEPTIQEQLSMNRKDPRQSEEPRSYQQIEVKYRKLRYPFWIPFVFIFVYIAVILAVFFIIN